MKVKVKKLDDNSAYDQKWSVFSDGTICVNIVADATDNATIIKEDDEYDGIVHDSL